MFFRWPRSVMPSSMSSSETTSCAVAAPKVMFSEILDFHSPYRLTRSHAMLPSVPLWFMRPRGA